MKENKDKPSAERSSALKILKVLDNLDNQPDRIKAEKSQHLVAEIKKEINALIVGKKSGKGPA